MVEKGQDPLQSMVHKVIWGHFKPTRTAGSTILWGQVSLMLFRNSPPIVSQCREFLHFSEHVRTPCFEKMIFKVVILWKLKLEKYLQKQLLA
ncbi:hypothetical protein P7D46_13115 [Enterococcus dongliensis]|nr:hypothetical protein [Enterococcus dongliensis]